MKTCRRKFVHGSNLKTYAVHAGSMTLRSFSHVTFFAYYFWKQAVANDCEYATEELLQLLQQQATAKRLFPGFSLIEQLKYCSDYSCYHHASPPMPPAATLSKKNSFSTRTNLSRNVGTCNGSSRNFARYARGLSSPLYPFISSASY